MNSSDHTPVKSTFLSENADAIMRLTPQHDVDRSDEELLDTFSAMKVTFHSKRFADNDTIEGSPVNLNRFKRIDLHPTPHKLYQSVPPEISSCPPNVTKRIGATSLPQSNNNESRKLLVICSASEEHNTGDHQENALRTALICGPGGCLRREELKGNIEWINSDNLTPAPLADLLRSVCVDFMRKKHI